VWWIFYGQQKGTNSMNAERIAELRDWINRHAWTDESGPFVSDLLAILDQAEALPELVEAARDLWLKTAVIPVDWKNLEAKELSANAVKSMDAVHAALAKIEAALEKPAPPAKEMIPADPKAVFALAIHLAMNDKKELLEKLIAELKPAPPAPWGGPTKRCEGCGRQAADDPAFPDDYCMKCWGDKKGWLRDKLKCWPGEMALTSEDVADLLVVLDDYGKPAPLPKEVKEAMGFFRMIVESMGPTIQFEGNDRLAVLKAALEKPAPPAETTDGTLTFKMPQATTAPPKATVTKEKARMALRTFWGRLFAEEPGKNEWEWFWPMLRDLGITVEEEKNG